MLFKNLFLLIVLLAMQLTLCSCDLGSSRGPLYDIREVPVGQENVYFKREIRGRNYEGFSISGDGNRCNGPSAATDFFVNSETVGKVFYRVNGDELQIYSQSVFTPPQAGNLSVKITQIKPSPSQFSEDDAKKRGFTELVFSDDSLKYCDR